MTIETLRAEIPDYAKDIRLNLGSLLNETVLSEDQKLGTFLASALATGNATVIKAVTAETNGKLPDEAANGAKAAAAIM
ncbi:MAG: alkyl hydroperoxide reductase, partial [Pseudomonadota bacterium]